MQGTMSMTHRKSEFIFSIVKMQTGDCPLFQINFRVSLIKKSLKRIILLGTLILAVVKHFSIPVNVDKLLSINKIQKYLTALVSELVSLMYSRSTPIYRDGLADRVEYFTRLISPKIEIDNLASNKFNLRSLYGRNTQLRLKRNDLRNNSSFNFGLLIEAASAASVSRASATPVYGVLEE